MSEILEQFLEIHLATGIDGIVVPESNSATINSDTIKASVGAVFYIPISKVSHLNDAIYEFKPRGFQIIGLEENLKNILTKDLIKNLF